MVSLYSVDTLGKGMIHVRSRMKREGVRVITLLRMRAIENLWIFFTSGIFSLIFRTAVNHGYLKLQKGKLGTTVTNVWMGTYHGKWPLSTQMFWRKARPVYRYLVETPTWPKH